MLCYECVVTMLGPWGDAYMPHTLGKTTGHPINVNRRVHGRKRTQHRQKRVWSASLEHLFGEPEVVRRPFHLSVWLAECRRPKAPSQQMLISGMRIAYFLLYIFAIPSPYID